MNNLKELYNTLATEYIEAFVKKQDYEFSFWIGDDPGHIAVFIDQYYINYDDIRFDIDNNVEVGLIFKWYDDVLEDHYKYPDEPNQWARINYEHYTKGLRFEDL